MQDLELGKLYRCAVAGWGAQGPDGPDRNIINLVHKLVEEHVAYLRLQPNTEYRGGSLKGLEEHYLTKALAKFGIDKESWAKAQTLNAAHRLPYDL